MGLNEVRRHEDKSGDDMFEDLAELLSDHGYSGAYQPAMRYPSQGVRIYIYICMRHALLYIFGELLLRSPVGI